MVHSGGRGTSWCCVATSSLFVLFHAGDRAIRSERKDCGASWPQWIWRQALLEIIVIRCKVPSLWRVEQFPTWPLEAYSQEGLDHLGMPGSPELQRLKRNKQKERDTMSNLCLALLHSVARCVSKTL